MSGHLAPPQQRETRHAPSLAVTGLGVGVLAAGIFASGDDGVVICPFRLGTGGYCPACGLTRALGQLLRGDVITSWHLHPYLLVALAQAVVVGMLWTGYRLRSGVTGRSPDRRQAAPFGSHGALQGPNPMTMLLRRHLNLVLAVNGLLLIGIWLIRIASGAVPAPFA